jgi:hypothetical protein
MKRTLVAIFAAIVMSVLTLLPTHSRAGDKKPSPTDEARARLFKTSWLDVKQIRAGVEIVDPDQLNGYAFTPKVSLSWGRRGELSAAPTGTIRVDATTMPMRIDFVSEPTLDKDGNRIVRVRPCIFKFEDGKLIIAGKDLWPIEQKLEKGMDYPERPRDFTSTKENKVTVQFLRPCDFYDQD